MRGRTEPARLDAGAVGRIGRRRGDRAYASYATGGGSEQEGYEGAVVQRRILLASDLSARCDRAFDRAVLLARAWRARLTIATALEDWPDDARCERSEEHTSELQSLMRISYAVFCLKKKKNT